MNSKNDAELVHLARSGNRGAYGELVRRYQRPIWGLAYLLIGDRLEAEDMTQEAFLRAWLKSRRQRIWGAVAQMLPRYRLTLTLNMPFRASVRRSGIVWEAGLPFVHRPGAFRVGPAFGRHIT